MVIVNPNSGPYAEYPNNAPGCPSLPGTDYCREVPKLAAFPNVTLIGYVRCDYCKKPLSDLLAEIETYAAWSLEPGLKLGGIYLDETPNHYTHQRAAYLDAVGYGIRATAGFAGFEKENALVREE